jgi:hypothetical protein
VIGLAAVLLLVAAVVVLVSPLRQVVLDPLLGVTPTAVAVSAPAKPGPTAVPTLPASGQAAPAPPTTQPAPPTPVVVTATPAPAPPTAQPAPPTAVPPTAVAVPLSPNQRLAQARDAAEAGNFSAALATIDELRANNASLAGLDAAAYDIHMAFAKSLLQQNNQDGAYEQFGAALKIRPNDPTAKAGQDGIILAKNYAIMEAAWGKDDDAGIKALEENMLIDPNFRETRAKLYSLLIMKADRQIAAGERDAAFEVLMRALAVLPDAGEAQKRLASYTPTPMPAPTAAPAPAYSAPASKPAQSSQPASQPAVRPASQPASQPAAPSSSGGSSRSNCPGGVCP